MSEKISKELAEKIKTELKEKAHILDSLLGDVLFLEAAITEEVIDSFTEEECNDCDPKKGSTFGDIADGDDIADKVAELAIERIITRLERR